MGESGQLGGLYPNGELFIIPPLVKVLCRSYRGQSYPGEDFGRQPLLVILVWSLESEISSLGLAIQEGSQHPRPIASVPGLSGGN